MKVKVKIPRKFLYPRVDLCAVIEKHEVNGVKLSYTEYGFIQSESARIVVFDAFSVAHKYEPIDEECGNVAFPFYLGCNTSDGERVAFAGLRFSEEKAVEWKLAGRNKVLAHPTAEPDAATVPLPSGVCCIADDGAYAEYVKHIKDERHPLDGIIVLDGQVHRVEKLFGFKYGVFSCGWGDGEAHVYIGSDRAGKPAALVCDFGMIESVDDGAVEVEADVSPTDATFDFPGTENEKTIAQCTRVIYTSKDPVELMRAYSRRGCAYQDMGDDEAATFNYTEAIRYGKTADRRAMLGLWTVYDAAERILRNHRNYTAAIDLMTDALAVADEFYAGAYVKLIELYLLTEQVSKATEISESMVAARLDDPVAYVKYAECCVASKNFTAAASAYDKLASEFGIYENLFDEASCFIELGDYESAESALDRHPAKEYYEQYWYYKAYIQFKRADLQAARVLALKAREIDGESISALYLLIDIEILLQNHSDVARYAEEYKRLCPDKEYGYTVCAEANLVLGNFSESAKNYCRIYYGINADGKYAALAALLFSAAGDMSKSKKMLKAIKHKNRTYYYTAMYGVYINNPKYAAHVADMVNKLGRDDDFLLILAEFFLQTEHYVEATRIMNAVMRERNGLTAELVALQIRTADRLGDGKLFGRFFKYYVQHYMSRLSPSDRRVIAERFMSEPKKRKDWLDAVEADDGADGRI